MKRNSVLKSGIGSVALCLALAGCGSSSPMAMFEHTPTTFVVLIDGSGSTAGDRALYVASLRAVAPELQPGDRLLVAPIGGEDRNAFHVALDVTVPDSDVTLDREEQLAKSRATVAKAAPLLVPEAGSKGSRSTLILAAIAAAAQAFGAAPRHGVLILLSDGVEEGPVVNLSKWTGDAKAITAQMQHVKQAGEIPDLSGVNMTVVGAGGAGNYAAVERWWRTYAAATHAKLVAYGRLAYRPQEQS